MNKKPIIGIIMGSDSDLPVMQDAAQILDKFAIPYELTIVSAHRTPARMVRYAKNAAQRGIEIIIAGAGGSAHLPGMVAALTHIPVIGVPIKSKSLDGLDSILSIMQMPGGVPVATVAINNATNAGILAAQILSIKYPLIRRKIKLYKNNMEKAVITKAKILEKIGHKKYKG